jgi:hypothetical protein
LRNLLSHLAFGAHTVGVYPVYVVQAWRFRRQMKKGIPFS